MKISTKKMEKISEQILAYLYSQTPKAIFTSHIALEVARDEEFIKKILLDLRKKGLVVQVRKNAHGTDYIRRSRWKLSDVAYKGYKTHQTNSL